MTTDSGDLGVYVVMTLDPPAAFDSMVDELSNALGRRGMRLDRGPEGRVVEVATGAEVGRVVRWQPGRSVRLEWHPMTWEPNRMTAVELRFEPVEGGTRVTMEHHGWGTLLEDTTGELAGWFAGEVVAPLLQSTSPTSFGDWLTDRRARRPSGARSEATYRNPIYHRPNFRAILDRLELTKGDRLVEVGCGGGAFLEEALKSGCRASAIDHSPEMVRLARETNRASVASGQLTVLEGDAEHLPFPDGSFTCAVSTGVFGFLRNPVVALFEIHRVLASEGRLVLFASSPDLRGTPAAPEPIASRVRFYEREELTRLAKDAGFSQVEVDQPNLEAYAREAGVPEAALPLFAGSAGLFLVARRA